MFEREYTALKVGCQDNGSLNRSLSVNGKEGECFDQEHKNDEIFDFVISLIPGGKFVRRQHSCVTVRRHSIMDPT